MRLPLPGLVTLALCAVPPVAALAQPAPAPAGALRFAPPADTELRYRVEARRSWRGGDAPPLEGTTRYDVALSFGPPGPDGGRRMTWRLLGLAQQGAGPAAASGAPGAPDIAQAVAEQLRGQPVVVDLFATGAVRGLANWSEVAAAFDRAARTLAAATPPEALPGPAGALPASAPPGGPAGSAPPAGALEALGAAAATELLLRDLAPLFGWGGFVAGAAPVADFARLRIAGLGAEAIARRERSLVRLPDGALEGRMTLRPDPGSLADTVRAAGRAAPGQQPRPEGRREESELRRLATADIAETAAVTLDAATGLPVGARLERATRAPGLFEQREEVTVARLP